MTSERVLVLFPHPDDETMAVGGPVALYAHQGATVTYACFTLGQMGRNMGRPFFATRESLPIIRERELRDACEALGIQDLRLLGYRDKTLEFEPIETLIAEILGLVEELQPTVVITYYPRYCVHPDHEAIADATVGALERIAEPERPLLLCQAFSQNHEQVLGARDVVFDTGPVWDRVYSALKAHASQSADWVARIEQGLAAGGEERQKVIDGMSTAGLYRYRFAQ